MTRTLSILFLLISFSLPGYAQGWQWGRGTIGNNAAAWPVATDHSGNVFVAGISTGAISFDNYTPSATTTNDLCVVAKYDGAGNFMWARSTQNGRNAFLIGITTDKAGNCYVLGCMPDPSISIGAITLYNTAYPAAQYFIAKYNPMGAVLWAKNAGGRQGTQTIPPIVFANDSAAKMRGLGGIATDSSQNIYVTTGFKVPTVSIGGTTLTNRDPPGATDDILLVKYDSLGNILWATSSGGTGEDIPTGITITSAGAIYVAGMFNSDSVNFGPSIIRDTATGTQKWNAFIVRYDSTGQPIWASGSGGGGTTYAAGVATDVSNNVYLTGGTAENNISFAGVNINNPYPGSPVLYVVTFGVFNNAGWHRVIGSSAATTLGYGISVSGDMICVCGAFNEEINIAGQLLAPPEGSVDPVFIAGLDVLGNYAASGALQSGGAAQAGISCDNWGNVYVCSDYRYPVSPFIIANDVLATVPKDEQWLYLAKFSPGYPGGPGGGSAPYTLYDSLDVAMCPEDSVFLIAPPGYKVYKWYDSTSDSVHMVKEAGTYSVTAIGNEHSRVIEIFKVKTNNDLCDCKPALPNAFTPNGDGENDYYRPIFQSGCAISHYAFSIYNRWGQRVFYSEDPNGKWDGYFQGQPADLDTYMFYLIYSTNPNYPEHRKKGDLTLVR